MKKENQAQWTLWGLAILCLTLLGPALLFGGIVPMLALLLVTSIVVVLAVDTSRSRPRHVKGAKFIAIVLGLLGSVIASWSALSAFLARGTDSLHDSFLWAGWLALFVPVLIGIAIFFLPVRPLAVSVLILISGFVGVVCIAFFSINTWYVLAFLLWILAVAVGLAQTRSS